MSRRGDDAFLRDIQEAVQRIGEYTAEIEYHEFLDDRKTQDAVIRNLEIIDVISLRRSLCSRQTANLCIRDERASANRP